jgi:hypothetical protein
MLAKIIECAGKCGVPIRVPGITDVVFYSVALKGTEKQR